MDCFASLAMTGWGAGSKFVVIASEAKQSTASRGLSIAGNRSTLRRRWIDRRQGRLLRFARHDGLGAGGFISLQVLLRSSPSSIQPFFAPGSSLDQNLLASLRARQNKATQAALLAVWWRNDRRKVSRDQRAGIRNPVLERRR